MPLKELDCFKFIALPQTVAEVEQNLGSWQFVVEGKVTAFQQGKCDRSSKLEYSQHKLHEIQPMFGWNTKKVSPVSGWLAL